MIKPLRKRHLQAWLLLAVLIPAGIISAVISLPKEARSKLLQPAAGTALPIVVKTVDKQDYTATLRCNTDTSAMQMEWVSKQVLTIPSALLYKVHSPQDDIEKDAAGAVIIGRVEAMGTYYFALPKDTATQYFILYDIIHHKKIDSLTF